MRLDAAHKVADAYYLFPGQPMDCAEMNIQADRNAATVFIAVAERATETGPHVPPGHPPLSTVAKLASNFAAALCGLPK